MTSRIQIIWLSFHLIQSLQAVWPNHQWPWQWKGLKKTVRFVKNLHVVDNGKGHYKDGNKQIRNCQTDQEHVGQLPDEDSFMKPVVRVWVFWGELGDRSPEIGVSGDGEADEGVAQDGGDDEQGEEQAQADRQYLPLGKKVLEVRLTLNFNFNCQTSRLLNPKY